MAGESMMRWGGIVAAGCALGLIAGPAAAQVRTLEDALAAAYANNPQLQAARAQLRATDEGVPQALAGWRPTVIVSGGGGYAPGEYTTKTNGTSIDGISEPGIDRRTRASTGRSCKARRP